jgi:hypothetical protein
MSARNKDGDGAAARPDGVTLLDKVAFYSWACERHQLEAADMNVLRVILFKVLGLGGAKAHNGWCTASVLARVCGLDHRTAQRALSRLQELQLVKVTGQRGRGGRSILHVAGVVGAAEKLPQRGLGDVPDDDEPPSKIRHRRRIKDGENTAQLSSKIRRSCRMNPSKESLYTKEPLEGVSGGAANRHPGEPPALNSEDGEEGAFGGEGGALTRPRQRLRDRVVGMASKLGLQDGGTRFLRFATEVTVGDWLRLQRERRDQRLVQAIQQALVDEYELDAEEAGRLLAAKAEPEPPPEPARPPAPEAKPPPPPASPRPSRPLPAVNGGAGPRAMADAIRGPALVPPPPSKVVHTADEKRASAVRLGIPLKGSMQ